MMLLHADLKNICTSKNLKRTGTKGALIDSLIEEGSVLTEVQAQEVLKLMGKAAVSGVGLEFKAADVFQPEEAHLWLTAARARIL